MPNPFGKLTYGALKQLSPCCYIFRNIVNSGVIITDDGVAVIDTQINEPMARRLIAAIRRITDKPIRYAINTHYHWDHWAGNNIFLAAGATLVGSNLTREFMEKRHKRQRAFLMSRGFSMPPEDPAKPTITFDDELTLHLGRLPIHLMFLGQAESDDATAVWAPTEEIAISGDTLMTGSFPILGQPVMNEGLSENRSWIRALERLKALGAKQIIPGHGNPGADKEIDFLNGLLAYFLDAVAPLVDAGVTTEEIIERLEAELPEKYRTLPEVWGTPRYAILRVLSSMTGWQHEKPSALPQADSLEVTKTLAHLEPKEAVFIEAARAAEGEKPELAIAIMDEAVRKLPKNATLWVERGDYFIEVRRCAEHAVELNARCGAALVLLGAYLAMGAYRNGDDPSEAMNYLEQASRLALSTKQEAKVQCYLGLCYRCREDEQTARNYFNKALELDPSYVPARLALMASDQ